MVPKATKCGTVAIIGRPNVGKSTLLNHLMGQKISITSKKAQTTRYSIRAVKTFGHVQAVFIDTPGLQFKHRSTLNHFLSEQARNSLEDADLIIFVIEGTRWTEAEDKFFLSCNQNLAPLF